MITMSMMQSQLFKYQGMHLIFPIEYPIQTPHAKN